MLWTNPGHQLDALGFEYKKVHDLYFVGINSSSKRDYDFLRWIDAVKDFNITFVSDISVHDCDIKNERVITFDSLCEELYLAHEKAVVILKSPNLEEETKLILNTGKAYVFYLDPAVNRRDNFIQNFVCIWMMYKYKKLLSHWTNYLVTTRCNLNCRCCLNFYNAIKNPQDINFDDIKQHIDILFSKFDYLYSLHISGGEPLLAKNLSEMIYYIKNNYGNRIFDFFVITNGTVMPNDRILEAIKSIDGHILLDNYGNHTKMNKLESIKEKLILNKIKFDVNSPRFWYDLDFGTSDFRSLTNNELEIKKDNCQSFLHEFAEGKIYACCYQKYAHRAGLCDIENDAYLDIQYATKMEILEFRQGYTKKGYVSSCKFCRGLGDSAKKILPALQIVDIKRSKNNIINSYEKDLVSICVPVYNTEKYLDRCVKGLLNQSYDKIEIILVDDGSTDKCGSICDQFAAEDMRVRVIHKKNGGEASARNAGLKAAKGEFVMFCDSDDEYTSDAVELLMTAIKSEGVDLSCGGYLEKSGEKEIFATPHFRICTAAEAAWMTLTDKSQAGTAYILSTVNAKIFRHEIIDRVDLRFDERFVVGSDSIFLAKYLYEVRLIFNICKPVYIYYKYALNDRVQGMAWYYPDSFYLYLYVKWIMITVSKCTESEFILFVQNMYRDWIHLFVNAFKYERIFDDGLFNYLCASCEIDLLRIAADYDLSSCGEHGDGIYPVKQISYLIKHKKLNELYYLFNQLSDCICTSEIDHKYIRKIVNITDNATQQLTSQKYVSTKNYYKFPEYVKMINEFICNLFITNGSDDEYYRGIVTLEKRWNLTIRKNQLKGIFKKVLKKFKRGGVFCVHKDY